jgi:hypothetical protein
MIVFARGSITDPDALGPHSEEEMRVVGELKAEGVITALYRRAETAPGSICFSRDPASTQSENAWTSSRLSSKDSCRSSTTRSTQSEASIRAARAFAILVWTPSQSTPCRTDSWRRGPR